MEKINREKMQMAKIQLMLRYEVFLVKHPLSKIKSGMPRWWQDMNAQQLHPHNRL